MMRAATAIESSTWTDAHLHLWDSSVLAAPWLANAPQELTAARAVNR